MDRRFLRPGWMAGHLLVFLAVLVCLRLGWWQWGRTHEATGTAQNFGYALLWPAFGAAFLFMWVRFLHLEVLKDAEDDEETERGLRELLSAEDAVVDGTTQGAQGVSTAGAASVAPADGDAAAVATDLPGEPPTRRERRRDLQRPSTAVTLWVATVGGDDDDDPELTAYNQALAVLAEEDRRRAR